MKLNGPRPILGVHAPSLLTTLALLLAVAMAPSPASADISRVTVSKPVIGGATLIGNDVAYDSTQKVYLVVAGYGAVYGVFVNTTGDPVSPVFRIGSADPGGAFGHYPRTEFSPHANGGRGGFLVTWHQNGEVHALMAAYPNGVISAEQNLGDLSQGGSRAGNGIGIAYSSRHRRFLVAWTTLLWGIQGRFVDAAGTPTGPVLGLVAPGGSQFPAISWNEATDEFGFGYSGWNGAGAFVVFQRLRADGAAAAGPKTFGFSGGTFVTEIVLNPSTSRYVMGWSVGAGSLAVQFDAGGNMIGSPGLISSRVGSPTAFGLAFNAASGTLLAVSEDMAGTLEAVAVELNGAGTPLSAAVGVTDGAKGGSFVPRVTSRTDAKEWNVSYSRDYASATNQIVTTGSAAGPTVGSKPKPDITVYRPSEGMWHSLLSTAEWTQSSTTRWGLIGDYPLNADFDGDGRRDIAVYRPSDGSWSILYSSQNFSYAGAAAYQWGLRGDIPMPADIDGDGKAELTVYRPSNGYWYVRFSSSGYSYSGTATIPWGLPGDIPLQADMNGDRRADFVVYRPSAGTWYVLYAYYGYEYARAYQWGLPDDLPVPGDFDGDGKTDLAVYRPSVGHWFVLFSSTDYNYGNWALYQWGTPGDRPIRGDYDGDGKADLVVYRPSNGHWYFLYSTTGYSYSNWKAYGWGLTSDVPVGGL